MKNDHLTNDKWAKAIIHNLLYLRKITQKLRIKPVYWASSELFLVFPQKLVFNLVYCNFHLVC